MSLRVGLVADGSFSDPRTNSGVARGILHGLRSVEGVSVVFAKSTRPVGLQRGASLAASFRLDRDEWRRQSHQGTFARRLRSSNRDRHIADHEAIELLIHVRNVYELPPVGTAYAAFIDATSVQSAKWSGWKSRGLERTTFEAEKRYFAAADFVFTASASAAESVKADYGADPAKVFEVGGGTNYLSPPERAKPRAPGHTFRLLFVGTDGYRKGSDLVIEAVRKMRARGMNVTATIVGAGTRATEAGITGLDSIWDRAELSSLFALHDAFVLPARHEPYGLVVQEAMAHGLPVIVSSVGALPSICQDGVTGIVCRDLSSDSVAEAATHLLEDSVLAEKMGELGRKRAYQEFSWERVAGRIVDAVQGERS